MPRDSYRSDVELLIMPGDVNKADSHINADDIEKQTSAASLFANADVDSLAWQDITVSVKDRPLGGSKDILQNVSGIVRPGQMMAIMGSSGSGKTTLLNTLAQRQQPRQGRVLINGQECPLATHRAVSAYVEQEDTLIGSLNVQETLRFAAKLALPSSVPSVEAETRVNTLIDAFGLTAQKCTRIGTPLQKGISGGQKRRVSVATQLVTGPRILYLDEPTSGLDSTASFEVMSYLRDVARQNNLIVVASIHQPSTKTLNLFSQITLLSKGKTCYFGSVAEISQYFRSLDMPIPDLTNPAEHMLDLTNVDFRSSKEEHARLEAIYEGWQNSERVHDLERDLHHLSGQPLRVGGEGSHAGLFSQVRTLLHRSLLKSYRDIVTYWIRLVMYMGLAIMMGTVWLRLEPTDEHIQPLVNAIFFGSAFMSFMAVAYVPAFLEDRASFVKERANGLYGPTAFLVANFLIGLPYLFLISMLFSIVSYWLINLRPDGGAFLTWVMWLFLDLVAAESLVVFMSSLFPNFVVALALIAFANGLWMCVGGFLVSMPVLNVFWKYVFHYIDYQAYVFQGMMVNEFKARDYACDPDGCFCSYQSDLYDQCKINGNAVLKAYKYPTNREAEWVGILLVIIFVYRVLGWVVTYLRKT